MLLLDTTDTLSRSTGVKILMNFLTLGRGPYMIYPKSRAFETSKYFFARKIYLMTTAICLSLHRVQYGFGLVFKR